MSVEVVVVARAGAPTAACLAALAAAGVSAPRVVVAGVDGLGLSGARNAALAGCTADVLALVEDDVAVAPGWFAALRAAWSADVGVGAANGAEAEGAGVGIAAGGVGGSATTGRAGGGAAAGGLSGSAAAEGVGGSATTGRAGGGAAAEGLSGSATTGRAGGGAAAEGLSGSATTGRAGGGTAAEGLSGSATTGRAGGGAAAEGLSGSATTGRAGGGAAAEGLGGSATAGGAGGGAAAGGVGAAAGRSGAAAGGVGAAAEGVGAAAGGVGVIGGPLRVAFPGGRPGWLTDATLAAFALQDLGPEAREVPVLEATFHGGNVSFRADALRAVGGFWPVAGHPDGRDWFSEEHHAQRELGAAGWTARWVPAAAAERLVPPDLRLLDLLRRRLRYGARDTLVGTRRPAPVAARTALTSAAGAALATLPRPTSPPNAAAAPPEAAPTPQPPAHASAAPHDAARTTSTPTPQPPAHASAAPHDAARTTSAPPPAAVVAPSIRPAPPPSAVVARAECARSAAAASANAPGVCAPGTLGAPKAHPWRVGAPGLAVERAARAAENAGALLGPWVAHADVQPGVRATPFQHTVPPPAPGPLQAARQRLGRWARAASDRPGAAPRAVGARPGGGAAGAAATILIYHRVAALEHDPLGLAVGPEHFAAHLDVLRDRGDHRTLEEVATGVPGVAITFDDGYRDNLTTAAPALRAAGLGAALFVATGPVGTRGAFWWDVLDRALRTAPPDAGPLHLDGEPASPPPPAADIVAGPAVGGSGSRGPAARGRTWPARTQEERRVAFGQAHRWLQGQPPAVQARAIAQACTWAGVASEPTESERLVTPDELTGLGDVFALGAHTVSHRSLGQASAGEQRAELAAAGDQLALWTGRHPTACSYPYGVPGVDVTHATLEAARALGYAVGVVNAPGPVRPHTDRLALPRRTPPDAGADAFAAWLDATP